MKTNPALQEAAERVRRTTTINCCVSFVHEDARDSYFGAEEVKFLDLWDERKREMGMMIS